MKDKFYVVATNIHTYYNKKQMYTYKNQLNFNQLVVQLSQTTIMIESFFKKSARESNVSKKIYKVSKHEFIQLSFILCLPVLCTILRLWKQITWDSLRNIRTTIKCDFKVYLLYTFISIDTHLKIFSSKKVRKLEPR